MEVIIQNQSWSDYNRKLITTESGSVQIELYDGKVQFRDWAKSKGTAFLYALWVNKEKRRQGIAGKLLDIAEQEIRSCSHKSVFLEWYSVDTPVEVLEWYKRRGYCERGMVCNNSGDEIILLEKTL